LLIHPVMLTIRVSQSVSFGLVHGEKFISGSILWTRLKTLFSYVPTWRGDIPRGGSDFIPVFGEPVPAREPVPMGAVVQWGVAAAAEEAVSDVGAQGDEVVAVDVGVGVGVRVGVGVGVGVEVGVRVEVGVWAGAVVGVTAGIEVVEVASPGTGSGGDCPATTASRCGLASRE
jgi:hypothetical protein